MSRKPRIDHLWSIILVGGQGELSPRFIKQWVGYPLSKRYDTFVGSGSLLQHTVDRADRLSLRDQKVMVVGQINRHLAWKHLQVPFSGQVVLEPKDCNSCAEVFLPLTYVLTKDANATVVIYPSDHFVFPEGIFVNTVRQAIQAAEVMTDRVILLGVRPTHPEFEYGWLEKGQTIEWGGSSSVHKVKSFSENPDGMQVLDSMASGSLVNTFVIAAKATTLWHLGWIGMPDLMDRFAQLRAAIGSRRETQVLQAIYQGMPEYSFSSDFLQGIPHRFGVMELEGVLCRNWRTLERIVETLRFLGKEQPSSPNHLNRRPGRGYFRSQKEVA